MHVERRTAADLDVDTLHDVLRLRVDVFVVEQRCAYPEVDGRDLEQGTEHWLVREAEGIVAYLRTLREPEGEIRIGRVVTAPVARGRGLAAALLRRVLDATSGPVVLDAQAHLVDWYRAFGFVVDGPVHDDAGIDHVPMRLAASEPPGSLRADDGHASPGG